MASSRTLAPYPVFCTSATMASTVTGALKRTCAFSVARLTVADWTPATLASLRSMRAEQEAHVMPVIASRTSSGGCSAVVEGDWVSLIGGCSPPR